MRKRRDPKYRHRKARNLAVVRIDGKDHYLGRYGSDGSIAKYHRMIADWRSGAFGNDDNAWAPHVGCDRDLSIFELVAKYSEFAYEYYRKNGKLTQPGINVALRYLRQHFGETKARHIGPKAIKQMQQIMIADNHSRCYINDNIQRIKRCFRWGAVEELIPGHVYESLRAVPSLKRNRSNAREPAPVMPVMEMHIEATLPHLSKTVSAMVRIQLLTAMRPNEICSMKLNEIEQTEPIWIYSPNTHKTQHFAQTRTVFIGPKARIILCPFLVRREAEAVFLSRHRKPYSTDGYRLAIRRACIRAYIDIWKPNQLRHTKATDIRSIFGLEAAQVVLGHRSANVTQIYAERDLNLAQTIAAEIG